MQLIPYLNFDGDCREAFEFYAQALRGDIEFIQTFGETPMGAPPSAEMRDRIMHVRLVAEAATLMGSDAMPGQGVKPQGFAVAIVVKDPAEAERIFNALSDKGKINMPIQQTPWADRFGMCTDKYGTPWIINGNLHDPT